MNYLKLVVNVMAIHDKSRLDGDELLLYMVLVKEFNAAGEGQDWPESLPFQCDYLSSLANMSIGTMKKYRLRLQQRGLIDFDKPGKGFRDGTVYRLLPTESSSKRSSKRSSNFDELKGGNPAKDRQKESQKDRQTESQILTNSYIYIIPNLPNLKTTKQLLSVAGRDVVSVRLAWVWFLAHKQPCDGPPPRQQETLPVRAVQKKAPPAPAAPPTIVSQIKTLIESRNPGYYWQAKDGGAARDIAAKLKNAIEQKSQSPATNEDIINALTVLMNRTAELPAYFHFTDLPALNGKFNEIITQLRSRKSGQPAPNGRPVAPAHRTPEQRASFINDVFAAIDSMVGG